MEKMILSGRTDEPIDSSGNIPKSLDDYINSPTAIKSAQKAIEMCLSDPAVVRAVVVDRNNFKVKVSKKMVNKTIFVGDCYISFGKVTFNEQRRIDNIKKNNKGIKKIAFTMTNRKLIKKLSKKEEQDETISWTNQAPKKQRSEASKSWERYREAREEFRED